MIVLTWSSKEVALWQVDLSSFEHPVILLGGFYLLDFQLFFQEKIADEDWEDEEKKLLLRILQKTITEDPKENPITEKPKEDSFYCET